MSSAIEPKAAPNALQGHVKALKVIFGLSVAQVCLATLPVICLAVIRSNWFMFLFTVETVVLVTLVNMT